MRYLDPRITEQPEPLRDLYVAALGIRFDKYLDLESYYFTIRIGDVIITSPTHSKEFSFLPSGVQIEIEPDGGKVDRKDTFKYALKLFGVPAVYANKQPTERAACYENYHKAVAWHSSFGSTHIELGEAQFPWKLVDDPTEAWNVIRGLYGRPFAYDFETTSLDPKEAEIVGIALANDRMAWYLVKGALKVWPELVNILQDVNTTSIASNVKYEYSVLQARYGVIPTQLKPSYDTQVMNWVYTSTAGGNDLKSLSRKYLGRDVLAFEDIVPAGTSIRDIPDETLGRYAAAGDARNSYDLFVHLYKLLEDEDLLHTYESCELELTPVLAEIELAGALIDRSACESLIVDYTEKLSNLEVEIKAKGYTGEPSQKDAFAKYLYDELKLPILKMTPNEERGSVDNDTLKKLHYMHECIPPYLEWVTTEKLLNTFIIPRLEGASSVDQYIKMYYRLQQTSTATGRLSSADPNMQNWPVEMRKLIVAPDGYIIAAWDYNQIEPRIAAVASGDASMLRAYSLPRRLPDGSPNIEADPYIQLGLDMEFDRPRVMSKEPKTRRIIKAVFLGWMFGAGPRKMQESAAKDDVYVSLADCARAARSLEANRPDFVAWRESVIMYAREHGEVRTMEMRRRVLENINVVDPDVRGGDEREAVNMITQGTAQDIIKPPMPKLHKYLRKLQGRTSRIFNQIHDELACIIKEGTFEEVNEMAIELMQWYPKVPLYIEGDYGKSWYDSKPA